jgi:hypothetical protein
MIAFNIDLDKINRARVFTGKTGRRYLSFILIDSPDQYGNAGQVVHSVSREERAGGGKGEVVGWCKNLGVAKSPRPTMPPLRNDGLFNSSAQAFDAAKRVTKNDQRNSPF